jgi:hypothetical protein
MRRLFALIVLLVFGSVAYADYEMSDSEKERYLSFGRQQSSSGADFALAVAPNGCYGIWLNAWVDEGMEQARRRALAQCKKKCKSSVCKIMDVNGVSDFIKQRGSSSSSSTASGSEKVWCATKHWVSERSKSSCKKRERRTSPGNQSEIPHDSALSRGLPGINDVSSA